MSLNGGSYMAIAIGIDNFEEVISNSSYIDKTEILLKIVNASKGTTFLFTRPRRFGKTLALSMMEYFFDETRKDSSSLFDNLSIATYPDIRNKHQNKYAVIHLNFKDIRGDNYQIEFDGIRSIISEQFKKFDYLKEQLEENDINYFKKIVNLDHANEQDLGDSIYWLIKQINIKTNKDVIVLIDEYDSPIVRSRDNDHYEQIISFFRSFYGKIFKSNSHLYYGILTGVTQIAKESIFSGLNNLIVNNVLSIDKEYFAFSEKEVRYLLEKENIIDKLETIKEYYGNYIFGDNSNLYNPWSVLNYINNNATIDYYWANTSENNLIEEMVQYSLNKDNILTILFEIIQGNIRSYLNQSITFKDFMSSSSEEMLTLLIFSGYLSIKKKYSDLSYDICIPNLELKTIFNREINKRFISDISRQYNFRLFDAFKNGDIDIIEDSLNQCLLNTFSSYEMKDEKSYQVMVLSLCSIAFKDHLVKSEQNVGEGRCDIIIYPSRDENIGIVIETKYYKSKVSETKLIELANKAIAQINNRRYYDEFDKFNPDKIIIFGFAFSKNKSKIIKEIIK